MTLSANELQELREQQDEFNNNNSSILEFSQRIGYADAISKEPMNGLILIDFRKVSPPSFMTAWPYVRDAAFDPWNYGTHGYYSDFRWGAKGPQGDIIIDVKVFNSYEDARREFFSAAETTRVRVPYEKCAKSIGTVCAMSLHNNHYLFFVYRNITIRLEKASNNTIAEKTAEWLFEVLKAFPCDPMDAPFKLRNTLFSLEKQL
jgi:hypothetical protein